MSVTKYEWIGMVALVSALLGYYAFVKADAPPGAPASAPVDGAPAALARNAIGGEGDKAGCEAASYASPFASGKSGCAAGPAAAPTLAAEGGDAGALRGKLDQVRPCQGPQQANNLSPECVKQNAGAASLVRQLEALVEQGHAPASAALAAVVQRERQARTASGEYLDELERAEAVLLRIAASGGIEAEKQIARPVENPADGPRFANLRTRRSD